MRKKLFLMAAYLGLLLLALPVPILHHYLTDRAIEGMRPVIQLADGSYSSLLLPAHILLLRWLGELSQWMVVGVFGALILSFWPTWLARPAGVCAVAFSQCAFTTLYAFYAALLLGAEWS